jgi:hypothetical protein
MTSVVGGEVKKQKGAFNYDLYELKLDFSTELESFVKEVSKFGVVSVTEKHRSTSLVKEVELQAQIPQENKLGVHHNSQGRRLSIFKQRIRSVSL